MRWLLVVLVVASTSLDASTNEVVFARADDLALEVVEEAPGPFGIPGRLRFTWTDTVGATRASLRFRIRSVHDEVPWPQAPSAYLEDPIVSGSTRSLDWAAIESLAPGQHYEFALTTPDSLASNVVVFETPPRPVFGQIEDPERIALPSGDRLAHVIWAPNGDRLAAWTTGGPVRIYDAEQNRWTIVAPAKGKYAVWSLLWSPSGRYLAFCRSEPGRERTYVVCVDAANPEHPSVANRSTPSRRVVLSWTKQDQLVMGDPLEPGGWAAIFAPDTAEPGFVCSEYALAIRRDHPLWRTHVVHLSSARTSCSLPGDIRDLPGGQGYFLEGRSRAIFDRDCHRRFEPPRTFTPSNWSTDGRYLLGREWHGTQRYSWECADPTFVPGTEDFVVVDTTTWSMAVIPIPGEGLSSPTWQPESGRFAYIDNEGNLVIGELRLD